MSRPARPMTEGTYTRLTSGVGQFALAIGACFLLVAVVMLISPGNGVVTFGGAKETLPSADPAQGAAALRLSAPYTSYAPQGLPPGWRATSSRVAAAGPGGGSVSWDLGYVTAGGEYASLQESGEQPAGSYISRMTNVTVGNPAGSRQIAGAGWTAYYRPDKKQRSLVRSMPGVALVVTGTASYDELAVLAGSLRPQSRG